MAKSGALALLLGIGKPAKEGAKSPPSDLEKGKAYSKVDDEEEESEEMDNYGASYDAAAESLLQQLNVPEGKRDSVKSALKETIHACMRGYKDEE